MIPSSIADWLVRLRDRDQLLPHAGIDVSHHQGYVDWLAVRRDLGPGAVVYLKATEGVGYVDPRFRRNMAVAPAAGLRVGAYHFCRPNTGDDPIADAQAEIRHFCTTIAPYDRQLPPVLDFELGGMRGRAGAYCRAWLEEAVTVMCREWVQPPVIYTGRWSLRKAFGRGPLPPWLTDCRLWWAEYTNGERPIHAPDDWPVWLWQYTAKGRVAGIKGMVDKNRMMKVPG